MRSIGKKCVIESNLANSTRYAAAPLAQKWEMCKRCSLANDIPVVVCSNFGVTASFLESGFGTRVKLINDEEPVHFQSMDPRKCGGPHGLELESRGSLFDVEVSL